MKQYSDQELEEKIHAFLASKLADYPESSDTRPVRTDFQSYVSSKFLQMLPWVMPLVAR